MEWPWGSGHQEVPGGRGNLGAMLSRVEGARVVGDRGNLWSQVGGVRVGKNWGTMPSRELEWRMIGDWRTMPSLVSWGKVVNKRRNLDSVVRGERRMSTERCQGQTVEAYLHQCCLHCLQFGLEANLTHHIVQDVHYIVRRVIKTCLTMDYHTLCAYWSVNHILGGAYQPSFRQTTLHVKSM